MNERERLRYLEGRTPAPGVSRLVVLDRGDGTYVHKGSGRVFTENDVQRLGSAVTVIQTRVVGAKHE